MKVGDYVRSDKGIIAKITNINKTGSIVCDRNIYYGFNVVSNKRVLCDLSKIIKSSPNIIDLIEDGDYVNGCLIVAISKDPFIKGQINLWTNMIISEGEPFPNEYYKAKILEKEIKSIVTHEQFEQMEYRIGE